MLFFGCRRSCNTPSDADKLNNISPGVAVTFWDNEKNDYDFANNVCDPNSKYGCGHYTQVVYNQSMKCQSANQ